MKAKMARLSVALVLVCALVAGMAPVGVVTAQATLYVDDDGCPRVGDGSVGNPYCTIAEAVAAANFAGGDTISVAPGTYNENNIYIDRSLTILGAGDGATIVDGGGSATVFIVAQTCIVDMWRLTIRNGDAKAGSGGGIENWGELTMTDCTVASNKGNQAGGGIYNSYNPLTLTNCTVSGNSAGASGRGGGIYNNEGSLTLINCTVTGNSAGQPGGGIYSYEGTVTMNCTIVYGNHRGGADDNVSTTLPYTAVECIIGPPNPSPDPCPDPLLGPLRDNGGPTETHALRHGSPAIDGCTQCTVATDQRGEPRPAGTRCDIGAYEGSLLPPPMVPAVSLWGSAALAVLMAVILAWSMRRRLATRVSAG